MQTDKERAEEDLRNFYAEIGADQDVIRVLRRFVAGEGMVTQAAISVTFQNDWEDWRPEYAMFIPGYFLVSDVWSQPDPKTQSFNYLVSYREFCDKFDVYLEKYYYPQHPEQRTEITGLMEQLRHSLGVDDPDRWVGLEPFIPIDPKATGAA